MEYELIWSEDAIADVVAIIAHVTASNPSAADRLADAIFDEAEILRRFPEIGSAYPPGSAGRLRVLTRKSYRIFHDVDHPRKRVEVVTVWHASRREPEHLN